MAEGLAGTRRWCGRSSSRRSTSDLVQRAAAREHWREMYVATLNDDGTVLEGYVDLIYRDDDGSLVIVDYKTDAVPAGAIGSRVTFYRPQMDAYVRCVGAATGAAVRAELLFLHPSAQATAVPVSETPHEPSH